MSTRKEIKIVIIGENNSGKELFCRALLLHDNPKIKFDGLSKLASLYLETDKTRENTKNIVSFCKKQNDEIMIQPQILSIKSLRDKNILPFLHYSFPRNILISEDIYLNYLLVGQNYMDYEKEIKESDIIFYIFDINKTTTSSTLLNYLLDIIKQSKGRKYLLPIANKADDLSNSGETKLGTTEHINISKMNNIIQTFAKENNLNNNLFLCIPISAKLINTYRREKNDPTSSRLKQSGFTAIKKFIVNIIGGQSEIILWNQVQSKIEALTNLNSPDNFTEQLIEIRNNINNIPSKYINSFNKNISDVLEIFLLNTKVNNLSDLSFVKKIEKKFHDDILLRSTIDKSDIKKKFSENAIEKMLSENIHYKDISPSKNLVFLKEILSHEKKYFSEKIEQLMLHLCNLYSFKIVEFFQNSHDYEFYYSIYFEELESTSFITILSYIQKNISPDKYYNYFIKIMLAKLKFVHKIGNSGTISSDCKDTLLNYLQTVIYYLSDRNDYLCSILCDAYDRVYTSLFDCASRLNYLLHDINDYHKFIPSEHANMEKYILTILNTKEDDSNDECSSLEFLESDDDECSSLEFLDSDDNFDQPDTYYRTNRKKEYMEI